MTFQPIKALLIALLAALLMLSACQTSTAVPTATAQPTLPARTPSPLPVTPTPQPTPTTPAHLSVDPSALKGVTVEFWHPWQGGLIRQVDDLAEAFNRSNEWGMTVRARPFYNSGALYDALNEAGPNSLPAAAALPVEMLAEWAEMSDSVVDLRDYLDHAEFGMAVDEIGFAQGFWKQGQRGGRQTGIPALRQARVLFYNQGWAKELGFSSPPETPEEFKQQACAAAVVNNSLSRDKQGTGGWLTSSDPLTTLSWFAAFDAGPLPEGADRSYNFDTPEGEAALAFLRGLYDSGCSWIGRNPSPYEYFSSRMALFYSGTLADLEPQRHILEQSGSADAWTFLPFPGVDGQPVVYSAGYSFTLLQSTPEQQLGAWMWIRWLSQPEQQARLAEAYPGIPVSRGAASALASEVAGFPKAPLLALADSAVPAPGLPTWRTARRVLEDAAGQFYFLPASQMDSVLPQIDQTIEELLQMEREEAQAP